MQLIESHSFHALVDYLEDRAPELVPACRWLACGPKLATLVLGDDARQPSTADLERLDAELDDAPAPAAVAGRALLAAHANLVARVDVSLDRLIAAGEDEWSHPTQVLGRPCPHFADLLAACGPRLDLAFGDDYRHLETVAEKLERAAKIEAVAQKRRENRP